MSTFVVTLLGGLAAGIWMLGLFSAVHAVMRARTAQGAVAWALSLVMFPFVTVLLYWALGGHKFQDYADARRTGDLGIRYLLVESARQARQQGLLAEGKGPVRRVLASLAKMSFTKANQVELLIDGEATFQAIYDGIDAARDYILVQFYIVRDDHTGRELKLRLMRRALDSVRVYFLYDNIGCHALPKAYLRELKEAGVHVQAFKTTRGPRNRFQINFRNHRKIVVVDGRMAYVGGMNVGDEYMGRDPQIGPWRDTHVKIVGPAVLSAQRSFVEDWYWATREIPSLVWTACRADDGEMDVLILPTGPADELETCSLFFVHMMDAARDRLWIASPYFVPDSQVMAALQLASLRGVDVRIFLPEHPDHLLVYLSSFSFLEEAELADVKIYRYQPGFMHHKVILVDDQFAAVGTANLDNRSFRLNFEMMVLVDNPGFAGQVQQMFERDFAHCKRVRADELLQRSRWFKVAVRIARLMAPIQ